MLKIDELLIIAIEKNASDIHLKVPSPPIMRIDGELQIQKEMEAIKPQDMIHIFEQVANEENRLVFQHEKELDFAYSIPGKARFRVNVLQQRGTMGIAFRMIPFEIPTIDGMGLPLICKDLSLIPRGLILVTGPTGSGKSTTMAAMVNHLNQNAKKSIITIEDPIEFLYHDEQSIIVQRDLGDDTKSFPIALKHALRHDPDVIIVGEMRDLDTIATAIMAAETGHLVLGTLHTTDAAQTIDRIIDIFPHGQQRQIRLQLSMVLEAIFSQSLLPRIGGGRIGAFEILLANQAVRNLIREEKTHELTSVMQISSRDGMQTLDQSLAELLGKEIVTRADAFKTSSHHQRLKKLLEHRHQTPY